MWVASPLIGASHRRALPDDHLRGYGHHAEPQSIPNTQTNAHRTATDATRRLTGPALALWRQLITRLLGQLPGLTF